MHLNSIKSSGFRLHIAIISILVLLAFCSLLFSDSQSLIAHDEGLYARRAKFLLQSGNWFSPFPTPHHKTVGSYWPIALSFHLFGINDWAARLPSIISGLIATILFYLTSRQYFKPQSSLTASLALLAMPIYFQALRTAGPDMVFTLIIITQVYLLLSIKNPAYASDRWKIIGFGVCISFAFFVRSLVAFVPLISLLPFLYSRKFLETKSSWYWTGLGSLLGSIPLLINLYAVYAQYGDSGLLALTSFASKKVGLSELALFPSFPFYFSRLILFTFPASLIVLSGIRRSKICLPIPRLSLLLTEINSLTVLFPLIYLLILSCMGSSHYHYLTPIAPFLALNVARLSLRVGCKNFNLETYLIGLLGLVYLLGACAVIFIEKDLSQFSSYFVSIVLGLCSITCLCIFVIQFFSWGKVKILPFALFFAIFSSQYFSLSALAASGIILNTNKQIKSLARIVNSDCKSSGAYLYGLDDKDITVFRFYLDHPHVLEALDDQSAMPKRCLIIKESIMQKLSQRYLGDNFSEIYVK
tara:strand:+ start:2024 stop:3607 length:1584 start_codon:yes stop_codon:yes gene_type:complete